MATLSIESLDTDLATALNRADNDSTVRCWWLGQAGFALRWRNQLLLIDPYLSDSLAEKYRGHEFAHVRMTPIPVAPEAIHGCTWCLCTHGHTDHMDGRTIHGLEQAAAPRYLIPRAESRRGVERGIPPERMVTINAGEQVALAAGITVTAIPAAHERLEVDDQGNQRYLGYIVALAGRHLYFSGDCIPYPGQTELLAGMAIDVAWLPINGRDALRLAKGVPGNFTVQEAIALCHAAAIPCLVGHHFEMFDFNTITRADAAAILEREADALAWILPEIGVTYTLRRAG